MNSLPKVQRLVPASEIAEILSVAPSTVRRWAAQGEIPSVRLPGRGRVLRFNVDEVLAACSKKDAPAAQRTILPKARRRRLEDDFDLGPVKW